MNPPIEVFMPSGAVRLGPDVCCDGFLRDAKVRVQTHVHSDHMAGFNTSKGNQDIILTEPTRRLLVTEFNADLGYRSNLRPLEAHERYQVGGSSLWLVSSGHMLGSAQVLVELEDGTRVGYSSDFQWPIDEVIEVDGLVVDSTYGSPNSIREFSQGECEEQFAALVNRQLMQGPVNVKAHRGTVQRALQILSDTVECPIIGSDRLCREIQVYRDFGYTIHGVLSIGSYEAKEVMDSPRHVRVYSTGDQQPADIGAASKITLSAYFTRPDNPINEYSDRAFGVAMSNHADFNGTLEYVERTRAQFVVADNTRTGRGHELAREIARRLGIEARPSTNKRSEAWGQ